MTAASIPTAPFGSTGIRVPVLGQGSYGIERAGQRAVQTLRAGIELGMTHIDTAEMYGSGASERIVGEAIAGQRERVFLVSKIMPENAKKGQAEASCDRSLKNLKTDYLDCYLLHWPPSHSLYEALDQMQDLQRKGKIRSFGVSNFDETLLQNSIDHVGSEAIACNQVLYYVKERAIEHKLIPFCNQHQIAVVAYSPFGQFDFPRGAQLQALQEVGERHGKSAHQIALAFVLRLEGLMTIPRTTDPRHAGQNAEAHAIELSGADLQRLELAFPLGPWRPGVPSN